MSYGHANLRLPPKGGRRKKTSASAAEARQRHLNLQGRRDALAKLRDGESTTIWASDGAEFRCFTVEPPMRDVDEDQLYVLVVFPRKRVPIVGVFTAKDGGRLHAHGCSYRLDSRWIKGIIASPENTATLALRKAESERWERWRFQYVSWLHMQPRSAA